MRDSHRQRFRHLLHKARYTSRRSQHIGIWLQIAQSTTILASFATPSQVFSSLRIREANCSGVTLTGSCPNVDKTLWYWGSLMDSLMVTLIRSTMSRGRPAGPTSPIQLPISNPGTALEIKFFTPGASGVGAAEATPSTFILPACTC